MKDAVNNMKLGIMVTAALILFVMAVYYIGSRKNMFGQTFHISSVFKNVNGLQPGNNVRYAGINVGSVDEIIIISDSTVQVRMKLGEEVREFIKKDAYASIGSDGLVGNMLVNISPGSGDLPQVRNEDRIASFSRTDTDDILNTLSSTNENIALLSRDLLNIAEHINDGQGTITALLKDTSLLQNLQRTLKHVDQFTSLSVQAVTNLEALTHDIGEKESLWGFLLKDTLVVSDLKTVISQISTSSENLQAASGELEKATKVLSYGNGPLNTLLYDSTVSDHLKESLINIKESSTLLNENMEAMRHNFLFRRYFKKQSRLQKNLDQD